MKHVAITEELFRELLEEKYWGAFHCGITLGGEWFDGARSDAEWLLRELGLDHHRQPVAVMEAGIKHAIEREFAAAPRVSIDDVRDGEHDGQ